MGGSLLSKIIKLKSELKNHKNKKGDSNRNKNKNKNIKTNNIGCNIVVF